MVGIPTFIINLERDAERRDYMRKQLENLGMQAEFVPAVDGRALSPFDRTAYDPAKALRVYGVEMMDSEIGCYLSHYRLYERIVQENINAALILEDDCEISPELPQIVRELVADPVPEWLVVRFDTLREKVREPKCRKFMGQRVKTLQHGNLHRLDTHVLGFGAYLIRKDGAVRMLDYGRRIFMPIDQTMDRYWENGIAPYIVRPIPARQNQGYESRIGARPAGRHRGQPFHIYLARRWQRLSDGVSKRIYNATH
jgi:glycosyl transferase, family 25